MNNRRHYSGISGRFKEKGSNSTLHSVCFDGDTEGLLQLLAKCSDSEAQKVLLNTSRDEHGNFPLAIAVSQGHVRMINTMLGLGVDVNVSYEDGVTPLIIACNIGDAEILELLLKNGASLAVKCDTGATPLYVAALQGHLKVAELLLQHGVNIDEPKTDGRNALSAACQSGRLELVKYLLASGANMHYNYPCGSLLHVMFSNSHKYTPHIGIITLVVERGLDINAKNKEGKTALEIATITEWPKKEELLDCLIANGADISLVAYNSQFSIRTMKTLAKYGWKAKEVIPVKLISQQVLEYSVSSGLFDLNAIDKLGLTVLDYVIIHEKFNVVQLLLAHGAKVLYETSFLPVPSPLHALAGLSPTKSQDQQVKLSFANLLIENGVNINRIYENRATPQVHVVPQIYIYTTALHAALSTGFTAMVQLLISSGANYEHKLTREGDKETTVSVWQLCGANNEMISMLGGSWTPDNHRKHAKCIRDAIFCFMLMNRREKWNLDSTTMYKIFRHLAYKWM